MTILYAFYGCTTRLYIYIYIYIYMLFPVGWAVEWGFVYYSIRVNTNLLSWIEHIYGWIEYNYVNMKMLATLCLVNWSSRIQWRDLCSKTPVTQRASWVWQSYGEVLVMLKLWGMMRTPLLPSLVGPLRLRVVAPDRVLSMDQVWLFRILIWMQTNNM